MYSCDGKAEFSTAITPVFSVTWFFWLIASSKDLHLFKIVSTY